MSKVCVVTGAGGVLCSSFAAEMAKNGYDCYEILKHYYSGITLESLS